MSQRPQKSALEKRPRSPTMDSDLLIPRSLRDKRPKLPASDIIAQPSIPLPIIELPLYTPGRRDIRLRIGNKFVRGVTIDPPFNGYNLERVSKWLEGQDFTVISGSNGIPAEVASTIVLANCRWVSAEPWISVPITLRSDERFSQICGLPRRSGPTADMTGTSSSCLA
jgi:hypothetical protein